MSRTIIAALAATIEARLNCQRTGNAEWFERHSETIASIAVNMLPHGSGIDMGVTVDLEKSTGEKVVLLVPYHCMSAHGFYCGWRDYTITLTPAFSGFHTRVTGRDYNDTKAYLCDLFSEVLGQPYTESNG